MTENGAQTELLSDLDVLLTMNITELLNVQQDVNNLLRIQFKQLEETSCKTKSKQRTKANAGKRPLRVKQGRELIQDEFPIGEPIKKLKLAQNFNQNDSIDDLEESLHDDTEDMILTQFEQNPASQLIKTPSNSQHQNTRRDIHSNSKLLVLSDMTELQATQESKSFHIEDNENSNRVYSSPLKAPNDSLPKEYDDIKKNLATWNNNILDKTHADGSYNKRSILPDRFELEGKNPNHDHKPLKNHTLIKTEEKQPSNDLRQEHIKNDSKRKIAKSIKILIFNNNPITLRPWILEDFKPNKDVTAVKRGKKKVAEFYKKVGKPIDLHEDDNFMNLPNNENTLDSFKIDFDNLRNRTDSPPGYGRLDFPTTQEREEDKLASKRILYQKTKHRFLASVNNRIPPQEREFLFKRDEFNEAVDNSYFKWERNALQIYPSV
ncbi:hypothetical protein C6P45_003473 [Maudiozyma exigua]|uniref:SAE2 n=1 Tax=Maudiozyma exigua TaxID=34358 RepID=A0A9P6WBN5_MAUEX|nr:hypothetical protein C6P45_003473 [Kazachstania exigua]